MDDSALEVVVEAAEGLEALGALNAAPVLAGLLHHHSEAVRQTAAQALERVADGAVLKDLLTALDDASPTVRFSLAGHWRTPAAKAAACRRSSRSRCWTDWRRCCSTTPTPACAAGRRRLAMRFAGAAGALWRCVTAGEDGRVQEKAWQAF